MELLEHDEMVIGCRKCERLVKWREEIAYKKKKAFQSWDYWGKPVPGFGDINGRVLVVGLAPGAHGSNRTGRMFTGDSSGDFLFSALNRTGFSNQAYAHAVGDGLQLKDMYISAVCRCVPPDNKPTKDEIRNCMGYLRSEIAMMKHLKIIVTLGSIAHHEINNYFKNTMGINDIQPFKHFGISKIDAINMTVISSYHPSRQNTQTGRLTQTMFDNVWQSIQKLI
jgi:uracil-DNA glycosylase family 4